MAYGLVKIHFKKKMLKKMHEVNDVSRFLCYGYIFFPLFGFCN